MPNTLYNPMIVNGVCKVFQITTKIKFDNCYYMC